MLSPLLLRLVGCGVLLIAAALALGGCVSSAPVPLPTPSYRITPPPVEFRPAGHAIVGCDYSRPANAMKPAKGDLVIGSLILPGMAGGYSATSLGPADQNGLRFAKVGVELPPTTVATISIAGPDRASVGIATEGGRNGAYTSVTYASCSAASQKGLVFWVGGFQLVGRASACVPLDVTEAGVNKTVRIALPRGACD